MIISKLTIRRLVLISTITTLVSLGLMVMGIVFPRPLLLVLAMSLGQLFGTSSLAPVEWVFGGIAALLAYAAALRLLGELSPGELGQARRALLGLIGGGGRRDGPGG